MPPVAHIKVVPTGGTIVLNITLSTGLDVNATNITIVRNNITASTSTTIYTGVYTPVFLDDGEKLPNYLDFATTYSYTVTDPGGTVVTRELIPAAQLVVTQSYLDKLLFRLFSAGINALVIPANLLPPTGRTKIRVLQAMPSNGSDILPLVVMNLDLEQQEAIQIGHDVNSSWTNLWTIPSVVFRRYSISVLTETSEERDYYKDACVGILYTMMQGLIEIGQDLSYKYQVAQSQVAEGDKSPGFFEAEVMLDIQGIFNVSVRTDYPVTETIAVAIEEPPQPVFNFDVTED